MPALYTPVAWLHAIISTVILGSLWRVVGILW